MNEIIKYRSSGRLGDFIHQLSVVNEIFLKTGRKGLIYLDNRFSFDNYSRTFSELLPIMKNQVYIFDFQIYQNQKYDIDLANWRNSKILYKESWFNIFNNEYKIDSWGRNKWLNLENIEKYNDCIIICTSQQRINYNFLKNVNNLLNHTNKRVIFTYSNEQEYEFFKKYSNFKCEFEKFETLRDWWSAISSCYLFIGNMSSPLTVAYACHKMNIAILVENDIDSNWFFKLTEQVSDKFQWYVSNTVYSQKVPDFFMIE